MRDGRKLHWDNSVGRGEDGTDSRNKVSDVEERIVVVVVVVRGGEQSNMTLRTLDFMY